MLIVARISCSCDRAESARVESLASAAMGRPDSSDATNAAQTAQRRQGQRRRSSRGGGGNDGRAHLCGAFSSELRRRKQRGCVLAECPPACGKCDGGATSEFANEQRH